LTVLWNNIKFIPLNLFKDVLKGKALNNSLTVN